MTCDFPPSPGTGGIPFVFQIKFKWLLEIALGANNSTMSGRGRYELSGPLGLQDGKLTTPVLKVREPFLGSLAGISPAVSGMVVAWETRVLTGVGMSSAAMAGPYTKLTVSLGVSRGSALMAPWAAVCKSETFKVDVGTGVGMQMSFAVADVLKKLLSRGVKAEFELPEVSATVLNRTIVHPDVPVCRL
jgi:hypothetical protein